MANRNCLTCSSVISVTDKNKVEKLDALFLLRILLEIPQDSQLVENINKPLNSIQLCDPCVSAIKKCKQIYIKIGENIERFWECQKKILKKFSQDSNSLKDKNNYYDDDDNDESWSTKCRKFVKNHDFTGIRYPFAVYDLETLLISTQPFVPLPIPLPSSLDQSPDNCAVKNDVPQEPEDDNLHLSLSDPLEDLPSPSTTEPTKQFEALTVKQEPESEPEAEYPDIDNLKYEENEVEDDNGLSAESSEQDNDRDFDFQPSPTKKPKISPTKRKTHKQVKGQGSATQIKKPGGRRRRKKIFENYPNFERDPTTKKFHCTWSTDSDSNFCTQKFVDRKGLHFHWDRHRGTPHQNCDECPQKFYARRDLKRHQELEHPKDGDNFECDICGKRYGFREPLLRHMRDTHDQKKEEERKAKIKKTEEDPIKRDPITKKWICWWPSCEKMYLDRVDLTYHLDRHQGTPQQKCEECGDLFYSKCQVIRHTQVEHERDTEFDCDICGDKFSCKSRLYKHKTYRHSGNGTGVNVVCQICGVKLKKGSLRAHLNSIHSEETGIDVKKFCCHLCPLRVVDGGVLKMHLWRVHNFLGEEGDLERLREKWEVMKEKGKRRWTCGVRGCKIRFVTEEGLRRHVEGMHGGKEGEGKLKCGVCGKGFHVKQKLTRHLRMVHGKKNK